MNIREFYVKNYPTDSMGNGINPQATFDGLWKTLITCCDVYVCKSRPAVKRASEFLKMFKSESSKINAILSEYPVVMGKFPKKYHSEIKRELSSAGFSTVANYLIGK